MRVNIYCLYAATSEILVGKICSRTTSHTNQSGEYKGRYNVWQYSLYGQNLVYIVGEESVAKLYTLEILKSK